MGVMLQAFFWDCQRVDDKGFQWWSHVSEQVPSLAKVGFTPLWLPLVHKAAKLGGPSMGYDFTNRDGRAQFYAPPGSYAVYAVK